MGRLTADPEGRTTVDGLPVTKFRLAVDRPFSSQGGNGTDFIDIVAWQKAAEVASDYLIKGQLVLVEGRIQNRSFEDQTGQRRWATEVVARNLTLLEKSGKNEHKSAPAAPTIEAVADDESVEDDGLESDLPF